MTRSRSQSERRGRVLLVPLLTVYLVLLAWAVLWKFGTPSVGAAALLPRPVKVIPFVPDGIAGGSDPAEVLANVLLFVPLGVYLGLLAPSWRIWHSAAACGAVSLILETVQHLLSTGSFDTSDVIANTAGGVVGVSLAVVARRVLRDRSSGVMLASCAIGTMLAMVAVTVFLASTHHEVVRPDVVVRR